MTREQILVIDDKIEIITFLTDLLEPLGYVLSTETSAEKGLAKALDERPDLILLDLNMPGMSGIEVLEALHRHGFQSPVILMTLYSSENVVIRALRVGVRDYIAKPFDIDELLAAIDRALETGRLQRERERLVAELSKTNQRLTQRMRELTTLRAVGRSVASLMPREELVRRIIGAAIYLTGADAGAVFLVDRDEQELRLEAVRQPESYDFDLRTRMWDSHAEDVLRSGQPLRISKPAKRTGVTDYLGQKAHSLIYVPIKSGDEIVGVMGLASLHDDRVLSTEMRNRLASLADYAAIALQNTQLYEDSQQQTQRLATVNQIAQVIASSLDVKEIMWTVVHSLTKSLHVERATLALLDQVQDELVFEVLVQGGIEKPKPFRVKMGQGIVGWVVQNGQALRVNDVTEDPRFFPEIDQATGFHTRSILCVPLTVSDKVIGAIETINKFDPQSSERPGRFTDQDEDLLCGTAVFVATAIENAHLHAAMRETVATQTIRDTVVTLSHYVNNPLQTLVGAIDLLKRDLVDNDDSSSDRAGGESSRSDGAIVKVIDMLEQKTEEISVVISVLHDIASPESTVYLGSTQMLDIEEELQARLKSVAFGVK
jgi:DNA-binding response OmpR family regulator/putative methionine-R-sulfoxide reductase with GAF domain